MFVRVLDNVHGREVFIVQGTAFPAKDNFMERLFWIDALKRASAASVTAVIPYFSYAKGDKKDEPRVSIRARVCADAIAAKHLDELVVFAPDTGFAKKGREWANSARTPTAHLDQPEVVTVVQMGRFELVIFDCDGVLVDSERLIVEVEAQICKERGWSLTEDDIIREFVGLSDAAMRARLSELVGEELPPDWDASYTERYRKALADDLEAIPGVGAVLDVIEGAGLATCVASSGSHEKMALTLGRTGLFERFSGRIYSATDPAVAAGKPAPDLFLHAAACMGVDPANCAVIEDSPYGITAALAAGMAPFGFAGSVIPADRLAADGVTVFDAMAQLPSLLRIDP